MSYKSEDVIRIDLLCQIWLWPHSIKSGLEGYLKLNILFNPKDQVI